MGLWVLAGSWSADQLTDGWVPDYIVARLDPDYREHAATLVRAGLWVEDEHDGDKGWRFHEWSEHQPSREQVLAERKAAAERQRRARERAKTRRDGEREPQGSHPDRHAVTHTEVTPAVTVPPTRPDPTRPELPTEVPGDASVAPEARRPAARNYDDDPKFVEFWNAYPLKKGKPSALTAWKKAIKNGADPDKVIAAAKSYRDDPRRKPDFTKHPGPWLNDERYEDQPAAAAPVIGGAGGAWWDN
jgi:hypothetical protein